MTMQQSDVAIIGAGIFGLSAAWALQKDGHRVAVYEAGRIGSGASGGLVGALSPFMPEKWTTKKEFQLKALLEAEAFWDEVALVSGLPSGYHRLGRLLPLRTQKHQNQAQVRAQEVPLLWKGQASWDVIDALEGFAPSEFGFVHETLSARLNPRQAITALSEAIRNKGGEIFEDHPVEDLDDLSEGLKILAAGHNCRAFTPDWPVEFWSAVKGQSALLDVSLPRNTPMIFESGTYVVPHGSGGVAVGSTSEYDWIDPKACDEKLDVVLQKAADLYPTLKGARVKERWAGLRPRARLPDPVVGKMPDRDAWILAGGFKIGLAMGPVMGEILASLIAGQEPDYPESYRLEHHLERCRLEPRDPLTD